MRNYGFVKKVLHLPEHSLVLQRRSPRLPHSAAGGRVARRSATCGCARRCGSSDRRGRSPGGTGRPWIAGGRPGSAACRRDAGRPRRCVRNRGYRASLELRKLYPVLPDAFADEHQMIRVIDESGGLPVPIKILRPCRFAPHGRTSAQNDCLTTGSR